MAMSEPALAPAPKGILDPRTGKPVGADDPFYAGLNSELADKGFLVTRRRRSHHHGRAPAR